MYDNASILCAFEEVKAGKWPELQLKDKQLEVLSKIVNGKSTVCVLPTGYGKSICFFLPPLLLNILNPEKHHIAIVISPLKSLMINQVDGLSQRGIKCACLSSLKEEDKFDISRGKVDVLFCSPEAVLAEYGRSVISSRVFKENVCLIAFDEGHCIAEWGEDFRPKYKEVATIRSFLSRAPICILTATTTKNVMDTVLDTLMLSHQDVEVVALVPNRPNIRLNIKHVKRYEIELKWYVDVLKREGALAPKALIYCRSMNDASGIYCHIVHRLGDTAWLTQDRRADKRLVDLYHGSLLVEDQNRITTEFPKCKSNIRCVVATIAFGMGVDVADVRYVFHWGPSATTLAYWQEVGRCSRNGGAGECYLFVPPSSLDARRVEAKMVDLCKGNECIRTGVLENLVIPNMDVTELERLKLRDWCDNKCPACECNRCLCCSRCYDNCPCNNIGAMSALRI